MTTKTKKTTTKSPKKPVKKAKIDSHLLMFHGDECPHCRNMDSPVKKLERELKVKVIAKEVWHNEDNAKELHALDNGKCGGVPFFYNKKNKKWICGECDYAELKRWAQ